MMGTINNEVYCGQCFEEFYGQEYCQNLRKDLEKLKDEFYECDSQRFWREWVLPTVNLLRRLVYMGFPVRIKDFIVVHLYNPVDSMAVGEMHFQVGRKVPGTLTMKFTKQNASGAYVIQPKCLSNAEEMRLCADPLAFLESLRLELRHNTNQLDTMQVLVLITDSCKLQRYSANAVLARHRNERLVDRMSTSTREPTSMFYQSTASLNPPISINPWQPAAPPCSTSFHPETSIRPMHDANFPQPWNFCVKNYVTYKTPTPDMSIHSGGQRMDPFGAGHVRLSGQSPRQQHSMSLAARQVSTATTCHTEPEESDETLEIVSEPNSAGDRVAELQRRMSEIWLWDAPAKTRVSPQPVAPTVVHSPRTVRSQAVRVVEDYASGDSQPLATGLNNPNSLPRSFSNENGRLTTPLPASEASIRRHSEPKITHVEAYFQSGSKPTKTELDTRSNRNSIAEKTSLTEEYVGKEEEKGEILAPGENQRLSTTLNNSPNLPRVEFSSYRTDLVDSYIGENVSVESSNDSQRSRTSSLDAYVGETSAGRSQNELQTSRLHISKSCDCLKPLAVPFAATGNLLNAPVDAWVYRQPPSVPFCQSRAPEPTLPPLPTSVSDLSILTQSSFSSWGSHRGYPESDHANPMIPLVVEKINRGEYQSWDHLASTSSSISSS